MPLYQDIEKKHHKLSNMIELQFKTISILKDTTMKIVYPLFFQMSSLQRVTGSKNYAYIFPSFISGLSEIAFLKYFYHTFGKTGTSPFFQLIVSVLVKHKSVNLYLTMRLRKSITNYHTLLSLKLKQFRDWNTALRRLFIFYFCNWVFYKHLQVARIMFLFFHPLSVVYQK